MANTKIEKQVSDYIFGAAWGYVNGIVDDGYEKLTEDQWVDYIMKSREYDVQHNLIVNGEESRHLRFYGNDNFIAKIRHFLAHDKAIQKYIKR